MILHLLTSFGLSIGLYRIDKLGVFHLLMGDHITGFDRVLVNTFQMVRLRRSIKDLSIRQGIVLLAPPIKLPLHVYPVLKVAKYGVFLRMVVFVIQFMNCVF